jgi:hypothetical protein
LWIGCIGVTANEKGHRYSGALCGLGYHGIRLIRGLNIDTQSMSPQTSPQIFTSTDVVRIALFYLVDEGISASTSPPTPNGDVRTP